ncbi:MAG: emopamil-binding family protein [Polyangiales bacterium]
MSTPLRERPYDWIFVGVFGLLTPTTVVFDLLPLLGVGWARRAIEVGYAPCDPMFVAMPPFLRVGVVASAVLWWPLYLYFAWGFVKGRNAIRTAALLYAGALTMAMTMIFAEALFSAVPGWRTPAPATFIAANAAYLVLPLALAWRMRSPFPFGGDQPG